MNKQPPRRPSARLTQLLLAVAAGSVLLSGCAAPLLLGGAAVGAALSASDRRSAGTQFEDESIERKASQHVGASFGKQGHFNITSYNRVVLLTGEVRDEEVRAKAADLVRRIDQVRSVHNELVVGFDSSLSARAADILTTGRVKTALADDKTVPATAVKVVTEADVVYLMGLVTEAEAAAATQAARDVSGVKRVVRLFELVSPAEAKALTPVNPPN